MERSIIEGKPPMSERNISPASVCSPETEAGIGSRDVRAPRTASPIWPPAASVADVRATNNWNSGLRRSNGC